MDRASNHLVAELEEPSGTRIRRLLRCALALVRAAWGDVEVEVDLVVRRRASGAEVLRTAADLGDPHFLLEIVRRDLETKTVEEFVREWRVLD
jgi:isocitrate lyase